MTFVFSTADDVARVHVAAPGQHTVGLMFRVGQADEPLVWRGITHLVEHLTLHGDPMTHPINGATGPNATTFMARGSAHEVTAFLSRVVARLAAPPTERMAFEAGVLGSEAAGKQRSTMAVAANLVFGNQRHGLLDAPELGLDVIDDVTVRHWAQTWFTRQNAVLWHVGPEPLEFLLAGLPAGKRGRLVAAPMLLGPGRHLHRDRTDGLAFAGLTPSTDALGATLAVIGRRLHEVLRNERGLAYGATIDAMPVSQEHQLMIVGCDAAAHQLAEVAEITTVELARIVHKARITDDLHWYMAQVDRMLADPMSRAELAREAGERELFGRIRRQPEEMLEVARSVTPADVSALVERFLDQNVAIVPEGLTWPDHRYQPIAAPTMLPADARSFASVDPGRPSLEIGTDAVGTAEVGVRFDQVVAMASHPDGQRVLWAFDGTVFVVHPDDHVDGLDAVRILDAAVSSERVVWRTEAGRPAPLRPQPAEPSGLTVGV